jgi:ubiquinone/menaquinone biosynthesis C-methylase UbiE
MDKNKYSSIGHRGLSICNPIASLKVDEVIEFLQLGAEHSAIDFGAGKSEFLIRLIERYGLNATAVELEDGYITESADLAKDRIPKEKLRIEISDALEYVKTIEPSSYDLAICMGSTHAFGGYDQALESLSIATKTGGSMVIADLYWKAKPDPEYLDFFGVDQDWLGTHEDHIKIAEKRGLIPLWACVASQDDWDRYEWTCIRNRERYVLEHPEDPDCQMIIERNRSWRDAYLKWGRGCLGFGLYLFQKV